MRRARWIAGVPAGVGMTLHPAFAQTGQVVRVGDALGDPYAQGYYAVDAGFFQKNGLNVDFQLFPGGSAITQAVVTGSIDIGITTPIQIANAVEHGLPLTIIAPGGQNRLKEPSGQLIVQKNSSIRTAKDLEGKTVALNARRTVSELALLVWMEKGGADPNKVKTIEIIFGEMGPAVERGTVDAASTTEPALSASLKNNNVKVIAETYNAIAPEFLISAWFTTQDYAKKNPDICKRFLACMLEVAKWANVHKRETGDILVKYGKLDPDLVRTMIRTGYAERLRMSELQVVLDTAFKYKVIEKSISANDLVFRG
jgi:NitT/TauT family transport system substrate-binding protein